MNSTATNPPSRPTSAWAAGARSILPPTLTLVVALLTWDLVVRFGWVKSFLLPPPIDVLQSFSKDWKDLLPAMGMTVLGATEGFAISIVAGIALAALLASSGWVRRAIYPYTVFFQTVPIIAIAPFLVIWAGYGLPTSRTSAVIVSIFPVIANTLAGLLATDPGLRDLFRLYGASPTATLFKLRLPSALPSILTGLRVAGGLAVIGTIVGEFIGGVGLGDLISNALTQQRTDKAFAAVLLASLLGLALFGLVNLASRLLLRHWHASAKD